ncbi:MAG: response regulator transcription factor [Saprospiraceae bacterium]|nr:response regulator transcription factor [Saprospiraceae bacterium]
MIKAIIVDDEQASIELLQWLIGQYCPDITELRSARSVKAAVELISEFEPDIVFLDINMPHQSGFDLLTTVENWNFEVIFTTAYNEFAIQAIRFSALDYLLKPIDETDLKKAVERFQAKRVYAPAGQELYRNFIQNISQGKKEKFKLALSDTKEVKYIQIEEIVRLQSESNYTHIFYEPNKVFFSAKTLKEYEVMLHGQGFLRVHKSHLVNPLHIKAFDKQGYLVLSDGSKIEVSRRKRDFIQNALSHKI